MLSSAVTEGKGVGFRTWPRLPCTSPWPSSHVLALACPSMSSSLLFLASRAFPCVLYVSERQQCTRVPTPETRASLLLASPPFTSSPPVFKYHDVHVLFSLFLRCRPSLPLSSLPPLHAGDYLSSPGPVYCRSLSSGSSSRLQFQTRHSVLHTCSQAVAAQNFLE